VASWENDIRFVSTYNSNNKITLDIVQRWNVASWSDIGRIQYAYDSRWNLLSATLQSLDNGQYTNVMRMILTYDAHDNMLSLRYQNWGTTAWLENEAFRMYYDSNDIASATTHKTYDASGYYVTYGDSLHWYFHRVIGIDETIPVSDRYLIYPNPASGERVFIERPHNLSGEADMKVVTIDGRTVQEGRLLPGQKEIDIHDLVNGVYYIMIRSGDTQESVPLVIQK
jgi:hypothetical protein